MKLQMLRVGALMACALLPYAGSAQVAGESAQTTDIPAAAPAAPPCCTIPALTVVELEIVDPASSRTSKVGERVKIRAAEPVTVGGTLVIPKGSEGYAEVIQASKARMMGKGGELTLGMPFLTVNGQRIGLKRLRYGRSTGHDATLETTIATAAVGVIGMVISGGNVDIQSGAQANAVVAADTPITPTSNELQ